MRKLNSVLFPIKYSEKFYTDIVQPDVEDFCQLGACALLLHPRNPTYVPSAVYYNDIPVGTMCCRLEEKDGQAKLYLMTLAVLAVSHSHIAISRSRCPSLSISQPYRSRGIGSQSLQHLIDAAVAHTKPKITAIYLHVQVSNDDAKKFYERHGFQQTGLFENYYKKITPHDAWILQRDIEAKAVEVKG